MTCSARYGFSPSCAKTSRRLARSWSSRLIFAVVTASFPSTRAKLGLCEKISNFHFGSFRRIRAVHRVRVDRLREIGAYRSRRCLLRIGGAHEVAVLRDRAVALEHLDHHRPRDHEVDERLEERTLAMHGIEAFGFALGEMLHLRGDDLEA